MNTLNRKGSLVSSRMLASVGSVATLSAGLSMGLMTETAMADLGPAAPVYLVTAQDDATPFGQVVDAWIGYGFMGYTNTIDSYFNGAAYTVDFSVGQSTRPGFEYEAVIDYTNAALLPGVGFDLLTVYMYVKGNLNAGDPITSFQVKDGQGTVLGGGPIAPSAFLFFQVDMNAVIAGGNLLVIQWNQGPVPAPGALALLGLSGLVGTRRRRS